MVTPLTYPTLCKENSYGDVHPIVKHECVGHVQKRMTNHINALKKKVNKDASGNLVKIGVRGHLTAEKTKFFQRYYGKAICSHTNDAVGMKNAVMVIFHHSASTDSHPQHHLCPQGERSWCKYKCAMAKDETPPHHNQTISDVIAPLCQEGLREFVKGITDGVLCSGCHPEPK